MLQSFENTAPLCEGVIHSRDTALSGEAALCDEASLSPTLSYGEHNVLGAFCGSLSQWLTFKLLGDYIYLVAKRKFKILFDGPLVK